MYRVEELLVLAYVGVGIAINVRVDFRKILEFAKRRWN
jgi:hypothetical protein